MNNLIETFLTSATLEIRFMPGIELALAARVAQAMLNEVWAHGSHGAQARVVSRDDHLSIAIDDVELGEMTGAAYAGMLERLQQIAHEMTDASR